MPVHRLRPATKPSLGLLGRYAATSSTTAATNFSLNAALSANGGTISASSTGSGLLAANATNGDRKGRLSEYWNDNTQGVFPDALTVMFSSRQNIGRVDVFGVQTDYVFPVSPSRTLTSTFALSSFKLQFTVDNGASWQDIAGASVTGNALVWNKFTFTPVATDGIRVLVLGVASNDWTRIAELECWTNGTQPIAASGTHAPVMEDGLGNEWTLVAGATYKNGVLVSGPGGDVYISDGATIYLRNSTHEFWVLSSGAWASYGQTDPTQSAQETLVTTLVTREGDVWSLGASTTGGAQILKNDALFSSTIGGAFFWLRGSDVYVKNSQSNWFLSSGGTAALVSVQDPTSNTGESADKTYVVGGTTNTIQDSLGRIWGLGIATGGGKYRVLRDGAPINSTQFGDSAIDLFYYRKLIFAHIGGEFTWYLWNEFGSGWVGIYSNPPSQNELFSGIPAATMSANRTRGGTVTDAYGQVWTLGGGVGGGNFQCLRDGVSMPGSGVEYTFLNFVVIIKNAAGEYYEFCDARDSFDTYDAEHGYPLTVDPLTIDDGTVDYGAVDDGLRGTVDEVDMPAQPEVLAYGLATSASFHSYFSGTNYDGNMPKVEKTWPDHGDMPVIEVTSSYRVGPNMLYAYRGFTPQSTVWLHESVYIDPTALAGIDEAGVKLSEVSSAEGSADGAAVRLWFRKPYRCLPHHVRLALYVYDYDSAVTHSNIFGDTVFANAFAKIGERIGLSLFVGHNTITGGSPNADGTYKIRLNGQTVLNITNRKIFTTAGGTWAKFSFEVYHGGQGAPLSDWKIQKGTHVVATVDPGPAQKTAVSTPAWLEGKPAFVPFEIPGTSLASAVPAVGIDNSGCATDDGVSTARCILPGPGGHTIWPNNPVLSINYMQAAPRWVTDLPSDANPYNRTFDYASPWGYFRDVGGNETTPIGAHLYSDCHWIESKQLCLRLGTKAGYEHAPQAPDANHTGQFQVNGVDYSSGVPVWRAPRSMQDRPSSTIYGTPAGSGVAVKVAGDIVYYFQGAGTNFCVKWDPSTETFSPVNYGGIAYHTPCFDSTRGMIVGVNVNAGTLNRLRISDDSNQDIAMDQSAGTLGDWWSDETGKTTYDPDNDLYWFAMREGSIVKILQVTPAGHVTRFTNSLPRAPTGGVNSNFHYFPALRAILYITGSNAGAVTWCIPTVDH
jgi:hypothetical protein